MSAKAVEEEYAYKVFAEMEPISTLNLLGILNSTIMACRP